MYFIIFMFLIIVISSEIFIKRYTLEKEEKFSLEIYLY